MKIKNQQKIGVVFTPLEWGKFAIEKFDIFRQWMAGATVFDPTMGNGKLLESLIIYGIENGYAVSEMPLSSLFGNEINAAFYNESIALFREKYQADMTANFTNDDILYLFPKTYDILFGNPPWQNFVDLPDDYKSQIKQKFIDYELVDKRQNILLGGARVDLAALVIQQTIVDFLKPGGQAYFFMPLSLLLNDGAHRRFRQFSVKNISFAPETIYDFNDLPIFENIGTRYGLAGFQRDSKPKFPVTFFRFEHNKWEKYLAKPLINPDDPLSVYPPEQADFFNDFTPIEVCKDSIPRQGVNTGGANAIYFFNSYKKIDRDNCLMENEYILPSAYVFPLLTKNNFKVKADKTMLPEKWVLLPYNSNGKILSQAKLDAEPYLKAYLNKFKIRLQQRRGKLIQAQINKGLWWAMLGVGKYNFMPYKIVWEAYGRKSFKPRLVKGIWQVNQSLQAYIPVKQKTEALKILKQLQNPIIETYLLSLKMEKTMNWAQPGKIKKLLKIKD